MTAIMCPYCDAECGIPDENSDEGEWREWECTKCEKTFEYSPVYFTDYNSRKMEERK